MPFVSNAAIETPSLFYLHTGFTLARSSFGLTSETYHWTTQFCYSSKVYYTSASKYVGLFRYSFWNLGFRFGLHVQTSQEFDHDLQSLDLSYLYACEKLMIVHFSYSGLAREGSD